MPVVKSYRDVEALRLTVVAEFSAPVERVWRVWEDPRLLERWWGPPGWPATFERHEFVVGGRSAYYMTGPDGQRSHGWWRITAIEPPHRLEFDDGFADEEGRPLFSGRAIHGVVTLEPHEGGTRMTMVSTFGDAEFMERVIAMGMEDGLTLAMGQIDDLLA
ncbi:activator of HSP90 ATPase [Thermopolyspora flexuosa]|jgi:uncharacterized protein YndB with AHSA1/START domain|uniref:Uncharacterized protein YndB with AHSA1/START domain n=1 Tax=Thermopolyspora flexuosa TaxID=103836 RepID=A0A543J324_9ACTN|nr:SRPBCC domain-containing protein [Thermopolyspora flexuosa]TQM77214.1 uncharacterized protein YndB with AHSA1/START domain [Thermopolyspora flexuosa]GGM75182.1 activator of HSP90 ATPase [Thermopolyspora flexuosa]